MLKKYFGKYITSKNFEKVPNKNIKNTTPHTLLFNGLFNISDNKYIPNKIKGTEYKKVITK